MVDSCQTGFVRATGLATTNFVYDAQGQLAEEFSAAAPPVTGTEYMTADHLGSTRMSTDASGNALAMHDYVPFGDEIPSGVDGRSALYGAADGVNKKFTGQYRDAETANSAMPSGLDFFGARYFSAAQGRFTTPDWSTKPAPVPYADLGDPQTLNKYGYVRNNPLRYTDPTGHCFWDACVVETGLVITAAAATSAWMLSPQGQKSIMATVELSRMISNKVADAVHDLTSKSEARPGTLGKQDHKETVADEVERVKGKGEVSIPTPGGKKENRRADAVGTNPQTGAPEIVQVYRPTPAGNIPKREKDAAADIEKATGIEPTMVPVRPAKPPKPEVQ